MIIKWHDAKEELPERSCKCFVLKFSQCFDILLYSNKYGLFNAQDKDSKSDAERYSIDVEYWAYIPTRAEVREDAKK